MTSVGCGVARLWWGATIGFGLVGVVLGITRAFDPRRLDGENVWSKPLKFAASLAVHYATCALVVRGLSPAVQGATWMQAMALATVVAATFEMGYIAWQAARSMPSHFNVRTPVYAALYTAMALAAVVVLAPFGGLGAAVALAGPEGWPPAARLGVAAGLLGATLLTLVTAFRMGGNMNRFVGPPPANPGQLPLLGWSLHGADLRPAHFMGLHLAQALPLMGWASAGLLPSRPAVAVTALGGLAWVALTVGLFRNALAGKSLGDLVTRGPRERDPQAGLAGGEGEAGLGHGGGRSTKGTKA